MNYALDEAFSDRSVEYSQSQTRALRAVMKINTTVLTALESFKVLTGLW